jgi:hypothetical protein
VPSGTKEQEVIAVIVPSRGRPKNAIELIQAFIATEVATTTTLQFVLDDDDPQLQEYFAQLHVLPNPPFPVQVVVGPRKRMGGSLNSMAPIMAQYADVIGFMGDDHRPRTKNWDARVATHFMDTVNGVVYGNDLFQGPNLPTAVFMDAKIIRTLGWMVLPGQIHLFMDNLWKTIGQQLHTLQYWDDMIIEHMHPQAGNKAEWDQTYVEANGGDVWEHDEKLYNDWVANQMEADMEKVRNA